MGFFDKLKISFGFGGHGRHHDNHNNHHSRHKHHHSQHEHQMVKEGRGVFAWIEKSGMWFEGDIPGVSGIMNARMMDTFQQCLDKLTENINDSISVSFSSFRQEASYDEILAKHPDAQIVFIPIYKK